MKCSLPLIVLLCLSATAWGQAFQSNRYGVQEGLAQSFVHTQLLDRQGFLWIGTQDGLSRFDGKEFLNFYHQPGNASSLCGNYIWTLYEDPRGYIWIGTKGAGLCRYDPAFGTFQQVPLGAGPQTHSVRALHADSTGRIWIGTEQGLFYWDSSTAHALQLNQEAGESPFFAFYPLDAEVLLVGGKQQLYRLNSLDKDLRPFRMPEFREVGFHAFARGPEGGIWAATGHGLVLLKILPADSLYFQAHFLHQPDQPNSLSSNYLTDLEEDAAGRLWIAGNQGLTRMRWTDGEPVFQHFRSREPEGKPLLPSSLAYTVLEVEPGWISVGTQEGLIQFDQSAPAFEWLSLEQLPGKAAHGLLYQPDLGLAGATENGIFVLSETDSLTAFTRRQFPQMQDDFVVNLKPGRDSGSYWAALRRGGYARIQRKGPDHLAWTAYRLDYPGNPNYGTNTLLEEASGKLWIGSSGIGLWLKDRNQDTFQVFNSAHTKGLEGNYIFHLMQDADHRMWISTADGGLSVCDSDNSRFQAFRHQPDKPESLSSDLVLSTFQDHKQRIWVCTANGLNLYLGEGRFRRFYQRDGLPNDVVYGMLEDRQGRLWVSTNQGLCRIQEVEAGFEFKAYGREAGLQQLEFNQHAFLQLSDGQLVFGGVGGLTRFYPDSVDRPGMLPRLAFRTFYLYNEPVAVEAGGLLPKNLNTQPLIRLRYDQNFIAFDFKGIHFQHPESVRYRYRLEGLDPDWIESGHRNFASYPDLKPGRYRFVFSAAGPGTSWNPEALAVDLVVAPPPWKTPLAYGSYALILAALIYSIVSFRIHQVRRLERVKSEERARFRKRSARDFHDEAGNRITRIALMTELAKRQSASQPALLQLLQQMEANVQDLRQGMRDFIWVLDPDQDNLYDTLLRLKSGANDLFEFSSIRFELSSIQDDYKSIAIPGGQRRHLILLFKEAMNNCIQYSKATKALLEVGQVANSWHFTFSDDGQGFDPEHVRKGNGLRNMKDRAARLGGKLDVESRPGEGVRVRLVVPAFEDTESRPN